METAKDPKTKRIVATDVRRQFYKNTINSLSSDIANILCYSNPVKLKIVTFIDYLC